MGYSRIHSQLQSQKKDNLWLKTKGECSKFGNGYDVMMLSKILSMKCLKSKRMGCKLDKKMIH